MTSHRNNAERLQPGVRLQIPSQVDIMSQDIPIDLIDVGRYRVRLHAPVGSGIEQLADSIREVGLLEPIGLLRQGQRYQLLYGERRLAAVKSLGRSSVKALVHPNAKDALLMTLTENMQRQDLNPLEEARIYQRMLDAGMTQSELGRKIGKTQSYIAQKLRLQRLPYGAIVLVELGSYTEAHLRQLLRLERIVKEAGIEADDIHKGMFEATRWAIEQGKPNNGVVHMVTYYQDKIAWSNYKATVYELRMVIDQYVKDFNGDEDSEETYARGDIAMQEIERKAKKIRRAEGQAAAERYLLNVIRQIIPTEDEDFNRVAE